MIGEEADQTNETVIVDEIVTVPPDGHQNHQGHESDVGSWRYQEPVGVARKGLAQLGLIQQEV